MHKPAMKGIQENVSKILFYFFYDDMMMRVYGH